MRWGKRRIPRAFGAARYSHRSPLTRGGELTVGAAKSEARRLRPARAMVRAGAETGRSADEKQLFLAVFYIRRKRLSLLKMSALPISHGILASPCQKSPQPRVLMEPVAGWATGRPFLAFLAPASWESRRSLIRGLSTFVGTRSGIAGLHRIATGEFLATASRYQVEVLSCCIGSLESA